ncbi:hypothetical protein B0T24DRAFT_291877 [Lasiosphaeria ovina]|uniref:Probable quinone oxidoreductase n=1 Tax=Lasiosphaeria ovina TaxID=92902 RepID=A0AAE0N9G1_9PEZI|nr:hypothetical protein B0T24DRAFT_291877 [Lasiosphaeria ovina]
MAPIPTTMSGVLIEKNGGPEVLQWRTDLPVPKLQDGEILIRNEFVGVNYIDTYFRTGLYKAALPLVLGREGAGTVVASASDDFKVGDRVAYIGERAYAELTSLAADKAAAIPAGITTETAAASMLQGLTALTFVREAAGIKRGDEDKGPGSGPWVLVHAAAGGTGGLLVQLLTVLGAKVIGTAGGPDKCETAAKNGAQFVIDSRNEDVVARVAEITSGKGVDVIFDGVGKATIDSDFDMIARKGTLVIFGNASGSPPPIELARLSAKNIKLMRPVLLSYLATKEERQEYTKELFELILGGKVDIKVHDVYPLKEIARAHSDLEGRKTTGKVFLRV